MTQQNRDPGAWAPRSWAGAIGHFYRSQPRITRILLWVLLAALAVALGSLAGIL